MYGRDLLDEWSIRRRLGDARRVTWDGRELPEAPEVLDELERKLKRAAGGGKRRPDVEVAFGDWLQLEESVRERAQRLYHRLVETGGTGVTYTQKGLLDLIGAAALPGSLPFWEGLVDYKAPRRDFFVKERRRYALAGIGFLVLQQGMEQARGSLYGFARHADPGVRRLALRMLVRACCRRDAPVPEELVAFLRDRALDDGDSLVRYEARGWLDSLELEVPEDNPGGVYRFKVRLQGESGAEMVLDLRSEQTLGDLHDAIQEALRWDSDHLYAFYISGELDDHDSVHFGPAEHSDPPLAEEQPVGRLGLLPGHKFLYLFDFGDHHEMTVTLMEVQQKAGRGRYPKIVKKPARPPKQYLYF
jgi:hypothetical protein